MQQCTCCRKISRSPTYLGTPGIPLVPTASLETGSHTDRGSFSSTRSSIQSRVYALGEGSSIQEGTYANIQLEGVPATAEQLYDVVI